MDMAQTMLYSNYRFYLCYFFKIITSSISNVLTMHAQDVQHNVHHELPPFASSSSRRLCILGQSYLLVSRKQILQFPARVWPKRWKLKEEVIRRNCSSWVAAITNPACKEKFHLASRAEKMHANQRKETLQDLTVLPTEFFRRCKTHIQSVIILPTESKTEMIRRWIVRR